MFELNTRAISCGPSSNVYWYVFYVHVGGPPLFLLARIVLYFSAVCKHQTAGQILSGTADRIPPFIRVNKFLLEDVIWLNVRTIVFYFWGPIWMHIIYALCTFSTTSSILDFGRKGVSSKKLVNIGLGPKGDNPMVSIELR